jgi:hypothetical protein
VDDRNNRPSLCCDDGGECDAAREELMWFYSKKALWDSLAYVTSMTDMCDVIFHVGPAREPVYGVKSLLSVRSR